MPKTIGVLALLIVSSLAAQPLTVGVHPPEPLSTATLSSTAAPVSYVNMLDFATAAGTVNKASVDWSVACSNAFKIVFLRASAGSFGPPTSFTVIATRGPFNSVVGRNDVTLSPPVTLALGDLIGIVELQPYTACGSVRIMDYGSNDGYTLITTSDLSSAGTLGSSSNFGPGYRISAVAYASDPVLVRVLPAAGATQGVGAFFRTALQLYNPSGSTITGNLVFHKQGVPGTSGDPTLPFTLTSGQVKSYPDVITTMGASGIGSLDIFTNGGAVPVAAARLFADGGTAGTAGFSEEGLSPAAAIDTFRRGILLTPEDPVNFRMNIGVRTLDGGVTISITAMDADSNFLGSRTATYPANYFEQVPFAAFTGVSTLPAGGRILISVTTYPGTIFIYSSVIDNRTSDSTFRMADIK